MKNRFGQCLRDRTLDAMDWVDIRPDPHWANFVVAPAVLGLSLYYIPSGFLPLFLALCVVAAAACFVLVLVAILGLIAWRTTQDIVRARLASMRQVVSEAKSGLEIQRGRI